MKRIHQIIVLGILFLLLQSCCNTVNDNISIRDNLIINNNKFLGEWYSVERVVPFESILKIDSNFNFTYEGGACVSRFGSNGYWISNDDTLILNSVMPKNCYYIEKFGMNCKITMIGELPEPRTTSKKDCVPTTDSVFILFENEKFIINDSVLIYIQKPNRLCPDINDDFTRKNGYGEYR
jgi:hypothetical protein